MRSPAIEIKNQARGRSLARQLWAIPRLMEYSVNPITWRRQRTASVQDAAGVFHDRTFVAIVFR